ALAVATDARHDEEHLGRPREGYERLLAGQPVTLAMSIETRLHRARMTAAGALGDPERGAPGEIGRQRRERGDVPARERIPEPVRAGSGARRPFHRGAAARRAPEVLGDRGDRGRGDRRGQEVGVDVAHARSAPSRAERTWAMIWSTPS